MVRSFGAHSYERIVIWLSFVETVFDGFKTQACKVELTFEKCLEMIQTSRCTRLTLVSGSEGILLLSFDFVTHFKLQTNELAQR